ncbi:hypothetical protein SKAU_G00037580 [Synaphobranchus kaupii]|uniref:Uncharacterized protein n=1 Tax=Synaphobranchus kaupii TaxID=118154 RepID=A0A9Q1JG58_SYNKA|nr:hypothetical protein SKAU_G00037580 [Synaphobranchus kaupii]
MTVGPNKIVLDHLTFSEARFRPSLEERLESIISGAALMADSSCTRDDRRERIVAECNAVRQALQDLLSEYMNNVSRPPCAFPFPRPISHLALNVPQKKTMGTEIKEHSNGQKMNFGFS